MNYNFDQYTGDKEKIINLLDKVKRVKKNWQEEFTDFLNPEEQYMLKNICRSEDVFLSFKGGKGNCERAMAVISNVEFYGDCPLAVIKVYGNFKFEKLSHSDYLGAVLSLGIKREKIGDINVFEDGAEIWTHRDICNYICINLTKIKHTGVSTKEIKPEDSRERIQTFKEIILNTASLRIDAITSAITGLSRTEAAEMIKSGKVKQNFSIVDEVSKKLCEGDLLSIKGFGRFKFVNLLGLTKRERLTILINKYT